MILFTGAAKNLSEQPVVACLITVELLIPLMRNKNVLSVY